MPLSCLHRDSGFHANPFSNKAKPVSSSSSPSPLLLGSERAASSSRFPLLPQAGEARPEAESDSDSVAELAQKSQRV